MMTIEEFIRKYATHKRRCRYPQLTCDCGYTRSRGTVDTCCTDCTEKDIKIRRLQEELATIQRDYALATHRRHPTDQDSRNGRPLHGGGR